MKTSKIISFRDFISIFLRSFFIQAVWNYQSMLSIGFCFGLIPAAKKLFKTKEERIKFLNRHLSFFNTHPYLASFALGAVVKIEELQKKNNDLDYSKLLHLKNVLIGPLGAIGDQLFWATIKPASLLIGILGVILSDVLEIKIALIIVMLFVYNLPHLYIRFFGILRGYQLGYDVYKLLDFKNYKTIKFIFGSLGSLALGVFLGFLGIKYGQENIAYCCIFFLSMLGAYYYRKWQQSFYRSIMLTLILAVLIGAFIENL